MDRLSDACVAFQDKFLHAPLFADTSGGTETCCTAILNADTAIVSSRGAFELQVQP